MPNDSFNGPLFITGASRSGTSYLYRLVNSLPGVRLAYESNIIKDAYKIFQRQDVLKDRLIFEKYLDRLRVIDSRNHPSGANKINSAFFRQPAELYDQLYQRVRTHQDFRKFIADLYKAGAEDCQIWGDKCETPHVPILCKLFPEARFLWIVRDVRAVVCSFYEHSAANYYTTSLNWVDTARMAKILREKRGNQAVLVLRYEDLVLRTRESFEQITSFIGHEIPQDLSMVNKAFSGSIEKWRSRLTSQQIRQIEEICFLEMKDYGYEPEHAVGRRNVGILPYGLYLVQHAIGLLRKKRYRLSQIFSLRIASKCVRIYLRW
jgi:hypothetical protein